MQIADANYLLRYILNDDEEQAREARATLDAAPIAIPVEVIFEVVYVLDGVYRVPRAEIVRQIKDLIDDIGPDIPDSGSVLLALDYYAESKLDFVDCMLAAYCTTNGATLLTTDRKLTKFIEKRITES
jgi:predicted nucleic-acid-binding protein